MTTLHPTYAPSHLLDIIRTKLQIKSDAMLSRMLDVAPPVISNIRHSKLPVGATMLIRMHELTGMPIRELRDIMGDRRTKYRLSSVPVHPSRT